jgi:peptidoglycan/LPS O-acetylase OafA/YrhL
MSNNRHSNLSQPTSILLDAIRISAAMVVVIGHMTQPAFSAGWPDLTSIAQSAVGVFFVLSGFVIYYTRQRHPDLKDYSRARLVRLWSVVVPSLAYTALADFISWSVNPTYYAHWLQSSSGNFVSLIADVLFLNQSWGIYDLSFGSNSPIWSIGYEAAYYALFGAFVYLRGRTRILIVFALVAIKGPQILVLLPVWLLGVFTCRILVGTRSGVARAACGWAALVLCLGLAVVSYNHYNSGLKLLLEKMPGGLGRSTPFTSMLLCGFATSGFILLAEEAKRFWGPLALILERPIRWLAQSTFSIYLFHLPTLILIQAVTGYSRAALLPKLGAFVAAIGVCIALSFVTERRKNWWNAPVHRILQSLCRVAQTAERAA